MLNLIGRLFIKNSSQVENPTVRRAWGTLASVFGIIMNLLLFVAKFTVGVLFGSVAIRADGINNLSDAAGSLVSLISFKISAKPADRDHPFGHARIEYVASLIVSFFILFIGVDLVREALGKLFAPLPVHFEIIAAVVLALSVLCKLVMSLFQRGIAKKIHSDVLRATATDSLSDACATAAVLIANLATLILPATVTPYIDPVMGLLVAVLVFIAGLRVLNDTKNSILGTAPTKETTDAIYALVAEYPEALGIHDLIVHSYGPSRTLASLHIEVDGKKDIFRAHDIIDLIERRLFEEQGISCTIHMDPIVRDDPAVSRWYDITKRIVKEIDPRISLHDFRMVPGFTHTNLIFDIAVPFENTTPESELKSLIGAKISQIDNTYFTVITIDRV
ncbi:MAG: cation transporter [Ruminococcaceae bacterium]|nr:cation transporter [Oscillospiraceae bacterium]